MGQIHSLDLRTTLGFYTPLPVTLSHVIITTPSSKADLLPLFNEWRNWTLRWILLCGASKSSFPRTDVASVLEPSGFCGSTKVFSSGAHVTEGWLATPGKKTLTSEAVELSSFIHWSKPWRAGHCGRLWVPCEHWHLCLLEALWQRERAQASEGRQTWVQVKKSQIVHKSCMAIFVIRNGSFNLSESQFCICKVEANNLPCTD